MKYEFELTIDGNVFDVLDELYESGCDDGTFSSMDGVRYGRFNRSAPSLEEAVASAKRDVESVPGLRVLRAELW